MKKAQSAILWTFATAVFIAVIVIFGYKAVKSINESNCISQLTILEADLKDSVRVKATDVGSREELKYDIPCKADYIFAVDLDKKKDGATIVKESFFDFSSIYESIDSGAKNNLFVVKGKKVIKSVDIGKLDISYPYYECYRVNKGRLALMLEGRGLKTGLKQIDKKYDCTLDRAYSLELADDDEDELCDTASLVDDCSEPCSSNLTIEQTDDLTITIDPCTGASEYWGELPKCVAQGIAQSLVFEGIQGSTYTGATCTITQDPDNYQFTIDGCTYIDGGAVPKPGGVITIDFGNFEIKIQEPDPLMVWHFPGGIIEGDKIRYYLEGLQKEITAECMRDIQGVVTDVSLPGALTAAVTADPTSGPAPLTVGFTCAASGGIVPYDFQFNFGDGSRIVAVAPGTVRYTSGTATATTLPTDYQYTREGDYTAACTVIDSATPTAATDLASVSITVNPSANPDGVCADCLGLTNAYWDKNTEPECDITKDNDNFDISSFEFGTSSRCCGNDGTTENFITSTYDPTKLESTPATAYGCCDVNNDCVDPSGSCATSGTSPTDIDGDSDTDYCNAGTWVDCFDDSNCDALETCLGNDCKPLVTASFSGGYDYIGYITFSGTYSLTTTDMRMGFSITTSTAWRSFVQFQISGISTTASIQKIELKLGVDTPSASNDIIVGYIPDRLFESTADVVYPKADSMTNLVQVASTSTSPITFTICSDSASCASTSSGTILVATTPYFSVGIKSSSETTSNQINLGMIPELIVTYAVP